MKTLLLACALAVTGVGASAQTFKEIGLGVIAGDPIGGTAKLWFDGEHAIDVGVGYSGNPVFWGDLLWHGWHLLPQPPEGRLGLYLGAGPRLEAAPDTKFGIRTIAGLSWRLNKEPLELFAEAGPVFRMTPNGGVDADGGVGVRVYLGGGEKK